MPDEQIAKMREAAMVASEFLEDLCVSSLDIVDLIDGYKALQQQNKTLLEALKVAVRDFKMFGEFRHAEALEKLIELSTQK